MNNEDTKEMLGEEEQVHTIYIFKYIHFRDIYIYT